MKKIKILILLFTVSGMASVFAQNTSLSGVKAQLNIMFSGLDKSRVPTGYLWDTAVNLIEAEYYNGSTLTDSNYVSLPLMGEMLSSINSASVGADTICVQSALSRIERNSSKNNAMVGILFKPYNFIVANALTDNLISYSNGIVGDVYQNGMWQNPYGETVLFGYATGNDGVVGQNTSFTIANIDSLSTQVFQSIQFDPGDGNGFRTVTMGGTVSVSYISTGYVESRLKVIVGGQLYQSHCKFRVIGSSTGQNAPALPPPLSQTITTTYQNRTYSAKITFKDNVVFRKQPLIVSEGFDPWRLMNKKNTHSYSGTTDLLSITNATDPADGSTIFDNYDVFYVDWYDYGADIRANAEVLKAVIRWVNSQNRSGEPNIVLGQSMGGLIARYALRDMELNDEVHNTTLFISHDVPHLGANVSPGLLYLYWDLRQVTEYVLPVYDAIASLFHDSNKSEVNNLGYYQSVRQMLPLYMDSTWTYNSTEYDSLMEELSEMGFPKGDAGSSIENVAIVNGGNFNSTNWYVDGNKLFHYQNQFSFATFSFFFQFFRALFNNDLAGFNEQTPGISTLDFQWSVYPYLSNNSTMYSVSLTLKKRYRWRSPKTFSLYSKVRNTPSSGIPLDAVSSSYYFIHNNPMIVDWSLPDYFALRLGWASRIPFVPTASAMAMPNDYTLDFSTHYVLPGDGAHNTPFTSYMYRDSSSAHISFFSGVSDWLDTVTQTEISCQGIALSGDIMTLSGNPHNDTFTWSATDGVSINSTTGQIDSTSYGITTLTATSLTVGRLITKTKKVMVGFPKVALSVTNVADGNYVVKTSVSGREMKDMVRKLVADSLLTYVWGVKEGTSDIVWQNASMSDSLVVANSPNHDDLVVLLKLKAWDGRESNPVFINVDSPIGFMQNLDYVYKLRHGDIVYDLFPMWPEIVMDYGHDCFVLFVWSSDVVPFEPVSITIDSYTYPLTEERTLQDGTEAFVFDVLYDQSFHDVFYDATLPYNSPSVKSIYVNTSLGVYEELLVFCMPEQL